VGHSDEYGHGQGSGSQELGLTRRVQDSRILATQPQCPVDVMEPTIDVADTFYSEAGGVDLYDTAVFPKVHIR
jgi:hypothetical protein